MCEIIRNIFDKRPKPASLWIYECLSNWWRFVATVQPAPRTDQIWETTNTQHQNAQSGNAFFHCAVAAQKPTTWINCAKWASKLCESKLFFLFTHSFHVPKLSKAKREFQWISVFLFFTSPCIRAMRSSIESEKVIGLVTNTACFGRAQLLKIATHFQLYSSRWRVCNFAMPIGIAQQTKKHTFPTENCIAHSMQSNWNRKAAAEWRNWWEKKKIIRNLQNSNFLSGNHFGIFAHRWWKCISYFLSIHRRITWCAEKVTSRYKIKRQVKKCGKKPAEMWNK